MFDYPILEQPFGHNPWQRWSRSHILVQDLLQKFINGLLLTWGHFQVGLPNKNTTWFEKHYMASKRTQPNTHCPECLLRPNLACNLSGSSCSPRSIYKQKHFKNGPAKSSLRSKLLKTPTANQPHTTKENTLILESTQIKWVDPVNASKKKNMASSS